MADDEDEYPRGTLMDTHDLTIVVKENDAGPFLAFEPGDICLKFRNPTTYEQAQQAAKSLRDTFEISTPRPYQPPRPPLPSDDDFGRGSLN